MIKGIKNQLKYFNKHKGFKTNRRFAAHEGIGHHIASVYLNMLKTKHAIDENVLKYLSQLKRTKERHSKMKGVQNFRATELKLK